MSPTLSVPMLSQINPTAPCSIRGKIRYHTVRQSPYRGLGQACAVYASGWLLWSGVAPSWPSRARAAHATVLVEGVPIEPARARAIYANGRLGGAPAWPARVRAAHAAERLEGVPTKRDWARAIYAIGRLGGARPLAWLARVRAVHAARLPSAR